MRQQLFVFLSACVVACEAVQAQRFTLEGRMPGLRDGVEVVLLAEEAGRETLAEGVAKDGAFRLQGRVAYPQLCTLITNNLKLVEQNGWPADSICWTYNDVFVDNVPMTVEAARYADMRQDFACTPAFRIKGGEVQEDFNEYNLMLYRRSGGDMGKARQMADAVAREFIKTHPRSVVSLYFANQYLERGYGMTAAEVDSLAACITSVPADTARHAEFLRRVDRARKAAAGGRVVDLALTDTLGRDCNLCGVIPEGKFVLVDFWASWCGMCLAAMPDIKALLEQYAPRFAVVGVSCDEKEDAWRGAMARRPMPWPEYRLTPQGYKDFFSKYGVGNGVPYYMMVAPDGRVLKTPRGADEIRKILEVQLERQ